LVGIEEQIDEDLKPRSGELTGWKISGEVAIKRTEAEVKNVIAVLEGEGPLADETVVVGAHYDHLGFGGAGSFVPDVKEIHNGADDNASGTAALLEVARQLAARGEKLKRRVVFIAFTAEERGLIGSARYMRSPLVPAEATVAMLNMDMVGRLNDEKLIVQGVDTATEFNAIVDRLNEEAGFKITKQPGGFGPSDHSTFYAKKVPVMHFFTGTHKDYHRPSDDADKLNVDGMRRVSKLVADVAAELADAESRPTYIETAPPAVAGGGGDRPYFGSIPDFSQDQPGYALTGVTKGGPAERAGIQAGDIIIQLGESKIGNLEDFDSALRKFKAGDRAPVIVRRGEEEVKVEVTLDPPR
jgi:membrane-associated protease RseP (regulator of RpoE activity)